METEFMEKLYKEYQDWKAQKEGLDKTRKFEIEIPKELHGYVLKQSKDISISDFISVAIKDKQEK